MDTLGRFKINNIYCEDCYTAIKDIPDKSVDLIYTDIPYDIDGNGGGCFGSKKRDYHAEYYKVCERKDVSDIAKRRSSSSSSSIQEISYGIDWSILDEFCRVLKHIYIYMV